MNLIVIYFSKKRVMQLLERDFVFNFFFQS